MTSCNGPISVPSDAGPMEQRRSGLNWDRFTRGSLSSQITEEGSDGMAKRIAELMVEVLSSAGVKRVYGVSGDSLNSFTDAIRSQKQLQWIHVRHEETAAFAAGAEAGLTGQLSVCAGSCGPSNLYLINGLYDCHRSRVPLLAIAARIPSSEIGSGYFQETHPEHLFVQCSHYCEMVSHPGQMPRVLEIAIQTAVSHRGVAVVVIPGDVALKAATVTSPRLRFPPPKPALCPSDAEIESLAKLLNESTKITIPGGAGCANAHAEFIGLAGKLNSPIVHAMRGKEFIEYDNPFDVAAALEHDGPALLEIPVSRQELSMPPKITLEQVNGFGLLR